MARQGNRQAGKSEDRGLQAAMKGQVHWVQQAEAVLHPGYLSSPRLDSFQKYFGQTPAQGMGRTRSRPAWPRPAPRIQVRAVGQIIRDAGALTTAIWIGAAAGSREATSALFRHRPRGLIAVVLAAGARRPGDRRT